MVAEATYSTVANAIGLTADKIKNNETILGVTGTLNPGTDTADATAVAADIAKGKTAYNANGKITGTAKTYTGSTEGYKTPCYDYNNNSTEEQILSNNNLDSDSTIVVLTGGEMVDLSYFPIDVHGKNIMIWHIIAKPYASSTTYDHQYVLGVAPSDTDLFIIDTINAELWCADAQKATKLTDVTYYRLQKSLSSSDYVPLDNTFTVIGPVTGRSITANHVSTTMRSYYSTNPSYSGSKLTDSEYILYKGASKEYSHYQKVITSQWESAVMIGKQASVVTPLNNSKLAAAIGLTANKIKKGETILGITGTYEGE